MGCRNDYLEPTAREKESSLVAGLLYYLSDYKSVGFDRDELLTSSRSSYGNLNLLDAYTDRLCSICKKMSKEEKDKLVYDGRNSNARKLADWWEKHQKEDEERIRKEEEEKRRNSLVHSALSKLSKEEIEALCSITFNQWRDFLSVISKNS